MEQLEAGRFSSQEPESSAGKFEPSCGVVLRKALLIEKGICEAGAGQAKHFVQLLFSKVYYYYFLIA